MINEFVILASFVTKRAKMSADNIADKNSDSIELGFLTENICVLYHLFLALGYRENVSFKTMTFGRQESEKCSTGRWLLFLFNYVYTSHNSAFCIEAVLFPAASIRECIYAKDDQMTTFQMMPQFGTGSIGVVPC